MISRIADYCFWLGRYIERVESSARLLAATRGLASDADFAVSQCWKPLVIVAGEEEPFSKLHGGDALGDGELVQEYLTWSQESMVSITRSVKSARHCSRAIRDQLSLDVWEEINELFLWIGDPAARTLYEDNRDEFYRHVRTRTQLILGLMRSTMLHEDPLNFLWAGVMLERVGQTARILDMHHHAMVSESTQDAAHRVIEVALWLSLLRACSGYEAFMKKYHGQVTAQTAVGFLLFDESFPRSLCYCLNAAQGLLKRIWPQERGTHSDHDSVEQASSLLSWLRQKSADPYLEQIHQVLTQVVDRTATVCDRIAVEILRPSLPESVAQSNAQA